MSELTDQLTETLRSDAIAASVGELDEEQAAGLGSIVMAIVNGTFGDQQQPQHVGPRLLSEQEFLSLDEKQLAKLAKYDEYVTKKTAQFAESQQATGTANELAAAIAAAHL